MPILLCCIGPAEEEQKVYLSPATLLVLPPTLIPHWLHQIRVHMKPNTLRVAVLASDRGSAEDPSSGSSIQAAANCLPGACVMQLHVSYTLTQTVLR